MVGKCANPECGADFRYLHEGRVFAIQTSTKEKHGNSDESDWASRTSPLVRYFWLCRGCLQHMEIECDRTTGDITIRDHGDGSPLLINKVGPAAAGQGSIAA